MHEEVPPSQAKSSYSYLPPKPSCGLLDGENLDSPSPLHESWVLAKEATTPKRNNYHVFPHFPIEEGILNPPISLCTALAPMKAEHINDPTISAKSTLKPEPSGVSDPLNLRLETSFVI